MAKKPEQNAAAGAAQALLRDGTAWLAPAWKPVPPQSGDTIGQLALKVKDGWHLYVPQREETADALLNLEKSGLFSSIHDGQVGGQAVRRFRLSEQACQLLVDSLPSLHDEPDIERGFFDLKLPNVRLALADGPHGTALLMLRSRDGGVDRLRRELADHGLIVKAPPYPDHFRISMSMQDEGAAATVMIPRTVADAIRRGPQQTEDVNVPEAGLDAAHHWAQQYLQPLEKTEAKRAEKQKNGAPENGGAEKKPLAHYLEQIQPEAVTLRRVRRLDGKWQHFASIDITRSSLNDKTARTDWLKAVNDPTRCETPLPKTISAEAALDSSLFKALQTHFHMPNEAIASEPVRFHPDLYNTLKGEHGAKGKLQQIVFSQLADDLVQITLIATHPVWTQKYAQRFTGAMQAKKKEIGQHQITGETERPAMLRIKVTPEVATDLINTFQGDVKEIKAGQEAFESLRQVLSEEPQQPVLVDARTLPSMTSDWWDNQLREAAFVSELPAVVTKTSQVSQSKKEKGPPPVKRAAATGDAPAEMALSKAREVFLRGLCQILRHEAQNPERGVGLAALGLWRVGDGGREEKPAQAVLLAAFSRPARQAWFQTLTDQQCNDFKQAEAMMVQQRGFETAPIQNSNRADEVRFYRLPLDRDLWHLLRDPQFRPAQTESLIEGVTAEDAFRKDGPDAFQDKTLAGAGVFADFKVRYRQLRKEARAEPETAQDRTWRKLADSRLFAVQVQHLDESALAAVAKKANQARNKLSQAGLPVGGGRNKKPQVIKAVERIGEAVQPLIARSGKLPDAPLPAEAIPDTFAEWQAMNDGVTQVTALLQDIRQAAHRGEQGLKDYRAFVQTLPPERIATQLMVVNPPEQLKAQLMQHLKNEMLHPPILLEGAAGREGDILLVYPNASMLERLKDRITAYTPDASLGCGHDGQGRPVIAAAKLKTVLREDFTLRQEQAGKAAAHSEQVKTALQEAIRGNGTPALVPLRLEHGQEAAAEQAIGRQYALVFRLDTDKRISPGYFNKLKALTSAMQAAGYTAAPRSFGARLSETEHVGALSPPQRDALVLDRLRLDVTALNDRCEDAAYALGVAMQPAHPQYAFNLQKLKEWEQTQRDDAIDQMDRLVPRLDDTELSEQWLDLKTALRSGEGDITTRLTAYREWFGLLRVTANQLRQRVSEALDDPAVSALHAPAGGDTSGPMLRLPERIATITHKDTAWAVLEPGGLRPCDVREIQDEQSNAVRRWERLPQEQKTHISPEPVYAALMLSETAYRNLPEFNHAKRTLMTRLDGERESGAYLPDEAIARLRDCAAAPQRRNGRA